MSRRLSVIALAALWFFCTAALARGAIQGPQEVKYEGKIRFVTRLADGRLFTAVTEGRRSAQKWNDTSVPERVLGRYSSDEGLHWTEPQFLFEIPGPGNISAPLFLGSRDGKIHVFITNELNIDHPIDWTKVATTLWDSVSRDGGRSWEPLRRIDYGGQFLGTLMVAIQLKSGRILLPFCSANFISDRATGLFASSAVYSDDGGGTWHRSKKNVIVDSGGKVIESGTIEPVAAELADGRVWMVMRTQTGYMFESYSKDGGETWSAPQRTIFRASNSPAAVLRLSSGPLVMLWNNEFSYNLFHGVSYCRQALAMVINDGSGWRGYRQVDPPFEATADDRGTAAYPFLVETGDGGILAGYGERRHKGEKVHSRFFRVDPRWLLETEAREDFSRGLQDLYMVGTAGGEVLEGPEGRPALRLKKLSSEQPSGISWNFPLGRRGTIRLRVRVEPGFGGAYFTLSEYSLRPSNNEGGDFRWMIGPDLKWKIQYTNNGPYLEETGPTANLTNGEIESTVEGGRTIEIRVEWDCAQNTAKLYRDGHFVAALVGMEPGQGISWLRISSATEGADPQGLWVSSLTSHSEP